MARRRDEGQGLDGILVLAKPPGPTSHDLVALVRRLAATRRVGHGGTLDPFASGVLPVFLGRATRIVEYHMGDRKAYRATICFGASSTTDDREGELTRSDAPAPGREAVESALAAFRGEIAQRPPAFSALRVAGRRAYELAREGAPAELAPRQVTIHRLDLVEWDDSDGEEPVAVIEIECSAGTYVRAIARDIGAMLGCGAYLGALIRTASGPFRLADSHTLDQLRSAASGGPDGVRPLLLPIDAGLDGLARVTLDEASTAAATRGQQVRPRVRPAGIAAGAVVRLVDTGGALLGIGTWTGGRLVPDKILVPPTPFPDEPAVGSPAAAANGGRLEEAAVTAPAGPGPASPDDGHA